MQVFVVQMRERPTGEKLSRDALRDAPRVMGELIIDGDAAYLCGGHRTGEWPSHGQVLPPLYEPRVRRLQGDQMVVVGKYLRDAIHVHVTQPQAWWCRVVQLERVEDADPNFKRDVFEAAKFYRKPGRR